MLVDKKQRLNRRWIASALTGSAAISIAARAPLSACFAGWTRYQLVVASAPRRANSSLLSHLHRRVRRRLPQLLPLTARRGFHRWPRATCRRCFFPAPPSTANFHNPGNAAAAREGERERENMGFAHIILWADVVRADEQFDVSKTTVKTARGLSIRY